VPTTFGKWALRAPSLGDLPDIPAAFVNLATDLSGVAMDSQGSFASRPTSSVGTPGKSGRFYTATDLQGSPILRDFGTGWRAVSEGFGTFAQRPTAATDLEGLVYTATDIGLTYLCTSAAWTVISASPLLVSTLPASPQDRQEVIYQSAAMATAGVSWHLRYRSAATGIYKWEYIGGPPLWSYVAASENAVSGFVWTDLTTLGPDITVPLGGDYDVVFGARQTTGPAQNTVGYSIGLATAAGGTPAITEEATMGTAGSPFSFPFAGQHRMVGMAASGLLRMRYRGGNVAIATFAQRYMTAVPVRVG